MRALILGGTTFLGLAVARELVARGHETALFTRGRFAGDPSLPVTRDTGDRDGGPSRNPRDGWDAVFDTSGYVPAIVAASCAHLARAGRYLFVSSISVYDIACETVGDGLAPYAPRVNEKADDDPENYSSKRRSEDVVRAVFDDRALLVRPGLIVGPHDPTNRFTPTGSIGSPRAARSRSPGRAIASCSSSTCVILRRSWSTCWKTAAPGSTT